jgi:4-hydroxyacetophenone monooxygenase
LTDTPKAVIDHEVLLSYLEHANLPALTVVLYQLTGDEIWLSSEFAPARARGLDDNPTGGYGEEIASTIRRAAADAIQQWLQGTPAAADRPSLDKFGEILEFFLSEPVPEPYWAMFARDHGITDDPVSQLDLAASAATSGFSVAIVGAGISGMMAAAALDAAGVPFHIYERASNVGGVWLNNIYPGAGVDTPSNLYSFPGHAFDWSTAFARREEVFDYLRSFAESAGLVDRITFNADVRSSEWDAESKSWTLRVDVGDASETHRANAVITAVGLFSEPSLPSVPGIDSFEGEAFHSSHWPAGYSVDGKKVAVVGSGASAMQVVPAIADVAEQVIVLQRSPQWIAPVRNYFDKLTPEVHWLLRNVPFYADWCRTRSGWNFNDKNYPALLIDPNWSSENGTVSSLNDHHRRFFLSYIDDKLGEDNELKAKVIPDYPPYGKRILLDNGWYDALVKPRVRLETEGLASVSATGVVTPSGRGFEVDTIVFCTGFQTTNYLSSLKIVGEGGLELHEAWGTDDAYAYLGVAAPGFPNLFFMYGPGTNAGGGSYITLADSQLQCIMQILGEALRRHARQVAPTAEATRAYNERMDDANSHMVWSHPGMTTYVRNARGRITVNMPWRIVDYWSMTANPDFDDFRFE